MGTPVAASSSVARWPVSAGVALAAGVLGTSLFVLVFGYWGLVHNARLYALQALARIHPRLGEDLFLRFGSQDDYSLFSRLFAPLIQAVGIDQAALVWTLLSLGALFAATHLLLARLLSFRYPMPLALGWALGGVILVAIWPVPYSAGALFHVAEPFASPRQLAAALGLLAVACVLANRLVVGVLAGVLALLIHPLLTWPALFLALLVYCRPWVAVAWVGMAALALLTGAWLELPLLGRFFQVMDAEWREITEPLSAFLWAANWTWRDWNLIGVAVLAPLLVAPRLAGVARKFFICAGITGGAGVLLTLIFSDGLHSLLILQVQPWRSLWVSHWLGLAGAGVLLARFITQRDAADLVVAAGILGAGWWLPGGLVLLGLSAMILLVAARRPIVPARFLPGTLVAVVGVLGIARFLTSSIARDGILGVFFAQSLVAGLLITLGALLVRRLRSRLLRRSMLAMGLVFILTLAGTRLAEFQNREQAAAEKAPDVGIMAGLLPIHGSLLWEGDIGYLWNRLHYPSYMSRIQLTGSVFSREKLQEGVRRTAHLEGILGPLSLLRGGELNLRLPDMDLAQVNQLCADPELAAIYFSSPRAIPEARPILNRRGEVVGSLVVCPTDP